MPLRQIMARAQTCGLLSGRPAELAEQFGRLLWGNLMVSLLLGVAQRPNSREIAARARVATAAFLQLHPLPGNAVISREQLERPGPPAEPETDPTLFCPTRLTAPAATKGSCRRLFSL